MLIRHALLRPLRPMPLNTWLGFQCFSFIFWDFFFFEDFYAFRKFFIFAIKINLIKFGLTIKLCSKELYFKGILEIVWDKEIKKILKVSGMNNKLFILLLVWN